MVVDDSPMLLNIIEDIIDKDVMFDTQVIPFSDASAAKDQFLSIGPDFVITDIEMPDFDGLQLIEYIRSVSETTILSMSGSNLKENSTETILYCAKSIGADYGIIKSDIAEKISIVVSDIISKHLLIEQESHQQI